MDVTCGGTFFGCDLQGSIYMGIAKYRGLCETTTGLLHAIPGELPATRFCTLIADSNPSKLSRCGSLVPGSLRISEEGNAQTLSFTQKRTIGVKGQLLTETQLAVRRTLPALFVTIRCRDLGGQTSGSLIHADGRHPHWGSRQLEAFTTADNQRAAVEPPQQSVDQPAHRWSGFDPSDFVPRGKHRKIVSNGWAYLHTKGGPGYGILVPDGACAWYDDTHRPFITTIPAPQGVGPGDARKLSYVLINAENPCELAAIVRSIPSAGRFAGSVLLGNPLGQRIEGHLSIKLPDGYTASPAETNIALDPGESMVCGICVAGKPSATPLPVEVLWTIPNVGQLRESGTVPARSLPAP